MLKLFTVENAKPRAKPYKLADGDGLHLLVTPKGKKSWRFRYHFADRENMLSFGSFPDVSLAEARRKCREAHDLLDEGIDPSQQRKLEKIKAEAAATNTFGAVAEEYIEHLKANGRAAVTLDKNEWLLLDLAKSLHRRPIREITAGELLMILRKVEKSGRRETARRLRSKLGAVFRYAIATARADTDPTYALRGLLIQPVVTHRAAITDERDFGALMASIRDYTGLASVRAALQFLALTMSRPGEVRLMRRSEVDFLKAIWTIPAARMKMRREHQVPLSRQALDVLRSVWDLSEGERSGFVFPSARPGKPLSENAFNAALRRMGYTKDEATAHGFRSSADTILNEREVGRPEVIEACLAHQEQNETKRAYNRARYWPERVKLLQEWADIIDELQELKSQKNSTRRAS